MVGADGTSLVVSSTFVTGANRLTRVAASFAPVRWKLNTVSQGSIHKINTVLESNIVDINKALT